MYEMIILAIVFYLIITNSFIRLQIQPEGVFLIIKKREYTYDLETGSYKEEIVIKIKRLMEF
tara:strand:- start:476 stop:661 length:186 start_codon:yes stop_codon:yes gene_type:complete